MAGYRDGVAYSRGSSFLYEEFYVVLVLVTSAAHSVSCYPRWRPSEVQNGDAWDRWLVIEGGVSCLSSWRGRFFVICSCCRAAYYKHHGDDMPHDAFVAVRSLYIFLCALTRCGIASGEWQMFALYVLLFWLSFQVLLWYTSQSGGADETRMIDITATVGLGVPLAGIIICFWFLDVILSSQFWTYI